MQQLLKSLLVGASSSVAAYFVSTHTLGFTSAFAMPKGFPIDVWQVFAVFGIGATLVAFSVHFLAIRMLSAKPAPAFLSFVFAAVVALAATGLLPTGLPALASWVVGALLASFAYIRLRPNQSFKPSPPRGSDELRG